MKLLWLGAKLCSLLRVCIRKWEHFDKFLSLYIGAREISKKLDIWLVFCKKFFTNTSN
jgi:hypothetical protein